MENKYCIHCGAAIKKSANICEECGKNTHSRYYPFYDFLKMHLKDDLKGQATDKAFTLIRKFLWKHLYGVVLSVSVVFSTVAVVAHDVPKTVRVTESPAASTVSTATEAPQEAPEEPDISPEDAQWLAGMADYVFTNYYDGIVYGDGLPQSQLLAELALADFPVQGVHEVASAALLSREDDSPYSSYHYFGEKQVRTGGSLTSDIAKELYSLGYEVYERNEYEYAYNDTPEFEGDLQSNYNNPAYAPDGKVVYNAVYVVEGDEVYLVEDRVIERY